MKKRLRKKTTVPISIIIVILITISVYFINKWVIKQIDDVRVTPSILSYGTSNEFILPNAFKITNRKELDATIDKSLVAKKDPSLNSSFQAKEGSIIYELPLAERGVLQ